MPGREVTMDELPPCARVDPKDRRMVRACMALLRADPRISDRAYRIAEAMADHLNRRHGLAWPSKARIAKLTGRRGQRSVARAWRELERLGVLRKHPGPDGTTSRYALHVPPPIIDDAENDIAAPAPDPATSDTRAKLDAPATSDAGAGSGTPTGARIDAGGVSDRTQGGVTSGTRISRRTSGGPTRARADSPASAFTDADLADLGQRIVSTRALPDDLPDVGSTVFRLLSKRIVTMADIVRCDLPKAAAEAVLRFQREQHESRDRATR